MSVLKLSSHIKVFIDQKSESCIYFVKAGMVEEAFIVLGRLLLHCLLTQMCNTKKETPKIR